MRNRTTAWLLLAGLSVGFAAHASEPASTPDADAPAATSNGMKAAIDPATGRFRTPTAAEMKALQGAANSKRADVSLARPMPKSQAEAERTFKRNRDGSVSMELPESSLSSVTATRRADGTVVVSHGTADGHANATGAAASE